MMTVTYVVCIVITLMIGEMPGFCDSIIFDGQIRERFEIMEGVNKKSYGDSSIDSKGVRRGNSDDVLLLQRVSAGFIYNHSKKIGFVVHLYDARAWGWSLDQNDFIKNKGTPDQFVMDPYEEYLELLNAYIWIRDVLIRGLSLKMGRQRIWYGDRRIFGPGCWGNAIGWIWDAARFSYKQEGDFIDFWYGQTKTKDPES